MTVGRVYFVYYDKIESNNNIMIPMTKHLIKLLQL